MTHLQKRVFLPLHCDLSAGHEDLATRSEDLAAVVDEEDLEPSSAIAAALAAMASAVQTLQNTPEPVMESGGAGWVGGGCTCLEDL